MEVKDIYLGTKKRIIPSADLGELYALIERVAGKLTRKQSIWNFAMTTGLIHTRFLTVKGESLYVDRRAPESQPGSVRI